MGQRTIRKYFDGTTQITIFAMLISINSCSNYHTQNTPLCVGAVPSSRIDTDKPPTPKAFCVMSKELWLPVVGYAGLYEVSNFGNVRSLGKLIPHSKGNGYTRISYGQLLSTQVAKRGGYITVTLKHNGIRKNAKVHRLVADAFLPNLNNLPVVNHKDFDRTNNRVENLEWCDAKYNCNYSKGRRQNTRGINGRKISAYNMLGEFIGTYSSIREAARDLNVFGQNICAVLSGKNKWCKGYTFKDAA